MLDTASHFRSLYRTTGMAYGSEPDPELMSAVCGVRGRVLDLGGGQGRHCLPLARMGFDVEVVDACGPALEQLEAAAAGEGLAIDTVCCHLGSFRPTEPLAIVVAALLFHLPAEHASLAIARRAGSALEEGGYFYLSMPGFDSARVQLAGRLLRAAGCAEQVIVNHPVTRSERPLLSIPRRNETRALGFKR